MRLYRVVQGMANQMGSAQLQSVRQKQMRWQGVRSKNIFIEVLGTGSRGNPCGLIVTMDSMKYMFNCGEGLQRLSTEYRNKISRIERLFVTSCSWRNIGGIAGLLLTNTQIGVQEMVFHGPQTIIDIVKESTRFLHMKTMKVLSYQSDDNILNTKSLQVKQVPITLIPKMSENSEVTTDDMTASGKRCIHVESEHHKKLKLETNSETVLEAMCFICRTCEKVGKLMLEKCVELGVQPGPDLGILKNGGSITLSDGRVLEGKDVIEPSEPGIVFLVVECPTIAHLEMFTDHSEFKKHQNDVDEDEKATFVFHFTPPEVMKHELYQEWIKRFDVKTEHVVINRLNNCSGSQFVYENQFKLNMVSSEMFPLLDTLEDVGEMERHFPLCAAHTFHFPATSTRFYLHPTRCIDTSKTPHPDFSAVTKQLLENVDMDVIKSVSQAVSEKSKTLQNVKEFPKVVMLGTGSSVPNKVRNTSGILLWTGKDSCMILDCGEGTFMQIYRHYGKRVDQVLTCLKAIYVSHLHADHHNGLTGILQERSRITSSPIYLIVTEALDHWLRFCNHIQPILHNVVLIQNKQLTEKESLSADIKKQLYQTLGVRDIMTALVKHCISAYGVAVTLDDGRKIVYSGDTMPCRTLVELGKNCDLLIHEATFGSLMTKEAAVKRHSTTQQALDAGKQMNAKQILLTHFSQRFSRIAEIPSDSNVGVAFDNMEISLDKFELVPMLSPALIVLFGEHYENIVARQEAKNWN